MQAIVIQNGAVGTLCLSTTSLFNRKFQLSLLWPKVFYKFYNSTHLLSVKNCSLCVVIWLKQLNSTISPMKLIRVKLCEVRFLIHFYKEIFEFSETIYQWFHCILNYAIGFTAFSSITKSWVLKIIYLKETICSLSGFSIVLHFCSTLL